MFEGLRQILPQGGSHKGTSPCQNKGCAKTTREGKPFCSEHIERAPYVKRILTILKGRDEEEAKLLAGEEEINPHGFFYKETLLLLRSKDFTGKALARRLDISHAAARRLIDLMYAGGLCKRGNTSRGDLTISGLGPRDLSAPEE